MNCKEFKAAVARHDELLRQGFAPPGTDACSSCGKPIQTFLTGREYLGDGSVVCSECYFDELGREVEAHPIGVRRGRIGRTVSMDGRTSAIGEAISEVARVDIANTVEQPL